MSQPRPALLFATLASLAATAGACNQTNFGGSGGSQDGAKTQLQKPVFNSVDQGNAGNATGANGVDQANGGKPGKNVTSNNSAKYAPGTVGGAGGVNGGASGGTGTNGALGAGSGTGLPGSLGTGQSGVAGPPQLGTLPSWNFCSNDVIRQTHASACYESLNGAAVANFFAVTPSGDLGQQVASVPLSPSGVSLYDSMKQHAVQFPIPSTLPNGSYVVAFCDGQHPTCKPAKTWVSQAHADGDNPAGCGITAAPPIDLEFGAAAPDTPGDKCKDEIWRDLAKDSTPGFVAITQYPVTVQNGQLAPGDAQSDAVMGQYCRKNDSWTDVPLAPDQSAYDGCSEVNDPLVLDLSPEPSPRFSSVSGGVVFDIHADGRPVQTAWPLAATTAFLVLDPQASGVVRDASQLFGNYMRVGKTRPADGFDALRRVDGTTDGTIDKRDPLFPSLRLWFDRNHDGKVQPGELVTLAEAGVDAILLSTVTQTTATFEVDAYGNQTRGRCAVRMTDGSLRTLFDVWLTR